MPSTPFTQSHGHIYRPIPILSTLNYNHDLNTGLNSFRDSILSICLLELKLEFSLQYFSVKL